MKTITNTKDLNAAVDSYKNLFQITITKDGVQKEVTVINVVPAYPNSAYSQFVTDEWDIIGYNRESENPLAASAVSMQEISNKYRDDLVADNDDLEVCEAAPKNGVDMGYVFGAEEYRVTLFGN